jgi:hypothetical protein
MAFLSTLTATVATRPRITSAKTATPDDRRAKLITAIEQQISYIKAEAAGKPTTTTVKRSGQDVTRKAKVWYWKNGNQIVAQIMYGTVALKLNKEGNTAFSVKSLKELESTYKAAQTAIKAGELDPIITETAAQISASRKAAKK